jgi:hypothetical protein
VLWGVAKLTKERSCGINSSMPSCGLISSLPSSLSSGAAARSSPMPGVDSSGSETASAVLPPGDEAAAAAAYGLCQGPKAEPDGSVAAAAAAPAILAAAVAVGGASAEAGNAWGTGAEARPAPAAEGGAALTEPTPLLALTQVAQLLEHLCNNMQQTMVQTISNSLWAVVVLQQEHGWCMCGSLVQVQLLLHAFCQQPREALPGHIQPVIRCMVQLATACAAHNGDAWLGWQPPVLQRLLGHLFAHRAHLEQHHISSVLRDIAQLSCILMLLQRRRTEGAGPPLAGVGGAPQMPAGDMLLALARSAGPPDTTSTMLALGMLRPQLAEMGLLPSVQHLCSMLAVVANYTQVRQG